MKLDRLPYNPAALINFYEEGLGALGALCERTWHDRLEVIAEGPPAKLWNSDGALSEAELQFASADTATARDASREVFPGCPLTFRLAEALYPSPLPLERLLLAGERAGTHLPNEAVAEKLWHAQFPGCARWRLAAPFRPTFHFSLVSLARCEIQAIDQHRSLHRLVLGLPSGESDESLARELDFAQVESEPPSDIPWPAPDPTRWQEFLRQAIEIGLTNELAAIRARQENYLRRELDRIDDYFVNYERELTDRAARSASQTTKLKAADRLAAARGRTLPPPR